MAKETITINNRVYKAKEIDFNFVCEMGMNGIEIQELETKIFPAIRLYIAYCMNTSTEQAGKAFEEHLINGGDFNEIIEVFKEKFETSDFFRSINKNTEKETPKRNTKKKTTEEVSE